MGIRAQYTESRAGDDSPGAWGGRVNLRAHPTVRPFALAIGAFPREGLADRLSFLGTAAEDLAQALFLDTLGILSTFPVRHRVVFRGGESGAPAGSRGASHAPDAKLPATWRELPQKGITPMERIQSAFADLFGLGAEAAVLLSADNPVMPFGLLFDGMMWLLPKKRLLMGPNEDGGLFAIGAAEKFDWLSKFDSGLGIASDVRAGSQSVPEMLEAAATNAGVERQLIDPAYPIRDRDSLKRLAADVAKGAFAPACRKLLERPDFKAHVGG